EIAAVGLLDPLDHLGVGRREIARRDGVEELVQYEACGGLRLLVAAAHRNEIAELAGGKQISVADRPVISIVLPVGRCEAPVARLVADLAGQRRRPEIAPLARGR